jgi:hypothetical protein
MCLRLSSVGTVGRPCMRPNSDLLAPSCVLQNMQHANPTLPPPPDLSDATPVCLYAVICKSDCPSGTTLLYFECGPPRGL